MVEINAKRNGFAAAYDAGEMVIMPDLHQEIGRGLQARYSALGRNPHCEGSAICVPLRLPHLNQTPYVLCIKCKRKNHFTEESRLRYTRLINSFAERILLEYCLDSIKDHLS